MNFELEVAKLGINLSERQLNQFEIYYEKLTEVNQYLNLTSITEKEDVYRKHFLDSLQLFQVIESNASLAICDVGSGAGFPAIPLAIVNSNLRITIIDALNKRISFLNDLVEKLNLSNVKAFHQRAEDYVKEVGAVFDLVTARAVARLNVLVELCLPLVKVNGLFLAMKGGSGSTELIEASNAIKVLGGVVEKILNFELPDDADKRQLIIIRKIKDTPKKYPRSFGKIKEKPL